MHANPYYDPEKFDLEVLAVIDSGEAYEFDLLVVWRRLADHALFWQQDSGCSCPTPFESHESVSTLRPIHSARDLALFLHELARHDDKEQVNRVARKVKEALR